MGGRESISADGKYNSSGNEYIHKLKNREYALDVRYKLKHYSNEEINQAIEGNKRKLKSNNEKMISNINNNVDNASSLNMSLYDQNLELSRSIKEYEYEQKKRKQDKKAMQKLREMGSSQGESNL